MAGGARGRAARHACVRALPRTRLNVFSATHARTTRIWFSVSVPVLSLQMLVALPIVSHAARIRMRFLSLSIFWVEKDSEMVTASGRPSGTATTWDAHRGGG